LKLLVVDDEPLARARLLRLLARLRPEAQCLEAGDGEQALAMVARHDPDLVLLDIRMPGTDGLAVAARLDEEAHPPAIIFCTAYDEYAIDALHHQAVAYILKPVRREELARALDHAGRVNRVQLASLREAAPAGTDGRTHISCQTHRGLEMLPLADIRCFLADQKYVTACGTRGELLIPDTLKDLETEFGDRFLRVHRNALVALAHVLKLRRDDEGSWYLELDGVAQRPQVSRRHLSEVKSRLRAR